MALQKGIVKSVLSGDTVILRGRPRNNGPPPERQLNLSYVAAPRLGSIRKDTRDEPLAFESRNFLRTLVVGKEVTFRVNHTVAASGLEFGTMYIAGQSQDVASICVREGWCRVRDEARRSDQLPDEGEELMRLEAQAQAQKKGIWSDELLHSTRATLYRPISFQGKDPQAFLDKYRGKRLDAIVEQVRDGSTLRLLVYLPDREDVEEYQAVTVFLSGIKSPIVRKGVPGLDDLVEPFGEEAKFFVESRLLQRDVKLILEGLAGTNQNFVGSVLHPAGNIAELLLASGLARSVDWSLVMVTGGPAKLQSAEQHAQKNQLRLWKGYVVQSTNHQHKTEFTGTVVRIVSADTILVRQTHTLQEHKLQLASVRQPKLKDPKEAGYQYEAKEFLRKRLIGKTVHVVLDFIRPATDEYDERHCATITVDNVPIADELVAQGLATVVRHRKDDMDRSSRYTQLLAAEAKATAEHKGMHSAKAPPTQRFTDASESQSKARRFLPFFQRGGRVVGVVEHVSNGGRLKMFIPKENAKITFVLSGIRVPRVGRHPQDPSEPYGLEAQRWTVDHCLQRDVEIEVESTDKTGAFIGTLWLDHNLNVAVKLLEEGLATLHEYSASHNPHTNQLFAAEREAKAQHKNLWKEGESDNETNHRQTPPSITEPEDHDVDILEEQALVPEYKDVVVSEIADGNHIYLQFVQDAIPGLQNLMQQFAAHHRSWVSYNGLGESSFQPKSGDICSARFTIDDQWYRARVGQVQDNLAQVYYVDYGNTEVIPITRLRPIPEEFLSLPHQAHEATLAFLTIPTRDQEYGQEAHDRLREMIENRQLVAVIEGRSRPKKSLSSTNPRGKLAMPNGRQTTMPLLHVTLYDPLVSNSLEDSINADLTREGLARVNQRDPMAKRNERQFTHLIKCQENAKKHHYGMFEYGDVNAEDHEE
ncbi:hypothetical protein IWQ62_001594 [Dispira parvispora]|uniref:Staphylococcal nuclease domain-containing protein n=1 Tax=Dispira parvispora TaxID=1520584 RepID=A0A9W8E4R7_9FUNG|nr:hypothetical protein IWQ62_001594 [Dispira parvispora]